MVTDAAGAEKLGPVGGSFTRLVAGDAPAGWTSLAEADAAPLWRLPAPHPQIPVSARTRPFFTAAASAWWSRSA